MTLKTLSKKQKDVLKWAYKNEYDNIICDGAVRSGKTVAMSVSFILWAMYAFDNCNFGVCGKSVGSVKRNILIPLLNCEDVTDYFDCTYKQSDNLLIITDGKKTNHFYVFGGKDESSYQLIQGITLCGVFFDEVTLMPQSFVDQAVARTLSVSGAKCWFNCNPGSPNHWFKKEWVDDADGENKKNSLHLHFLMSDNPIMTDEKIEKAVTLYSGVFYQRYILGLWVLAEGLVYPQFSKEEHIKALPKEASGEYYISIDYGTTNPCSMGLWCDTGEGAYRIKEYYHNSRVEKEQKTDEEYYSELVKLADGYKIKQVIVDPSAASFITLIRKYGKFSVRKAENDVIDGIRYTSSLLSQNKIFIDKSCKDIIDEFSLYSWDEKRTDKDVVLKINDHAMDDMRYFCNTILKYEKFYMPETEKPKSRVSVNYGITYEDMNGGWS